MFFLGVTGRITNPPQNTVAEVGGQAIFNCTSDLAVPSWIFSKTREEVVASTGQNIVANCAVLPGFATHYDVDRQGGSNNSCNLIINATTMQQAGVYTCTDIQTGPSAILTTIGRLQHIYLIILNYVIWLSISSSTGGSSLNRHRHTMLCCSIICLASFIRIMKADSNTTFLWSDAVSDAKMV